MLSSTICGSAAIVPRRVVVEAVAGVAFEAEPRGLAPPQRGCGRIRGRPSPSSPCATASHQAPVCSSTTGALKRSRRLQRFRRRLDEQRDPDARARRVRRRTASGDRAADDVEAAFGRALGALLRHQAAGVRLDVCSAMSSICSVAAISKLSGLRDLTLSGAACRRRGCGGGPRADAR